MKRIFKYLGVMLLAPLLLLLVALLITQTSAFRSWLKNKAVSLAQAYLDGEITVTRLNGNLFQRLELEGVSITQRDEPVITVTRAVLHYDPLALFSNRLHVWQIKLVEPRVKLIQRDDGTWNLAELIKIPEDTVATDSAAAWDLVIDSFEIDSGQVELHGLDSLQASVPRRFENLQTGLAFSWVDEEAKLDLKQLSFAAHDPELSFQMAPSQLELSEAEPGQQKLEVSSAAAIVMSGFEMQNFKIYGNPRLHATARGSLEEMFINLNLAIGNGELKLASQLKIDKEPYAYQLAGEVNRLNLQEVTHSAALASDLNFEFELAGQGVTWGEIEANFVVTVDTGYAFGRTFEAIILEGETRGDSVFFNGNLAALGTRSNYAGSLVANERRTAYTVHGDFQHLNLEKIGGDTTLSSDLSFKFFLDGQGTKPEELSGQFVLEFSPSTINRVTLDTAHVDASWQHEILHLNNFTLLSPQAEISAQGQLSQNQNDAIQFTGQVRDLSQLAEITGMEALHGDGQFSGNIRGPIETMQLDAVMNFKNVGMQEVTIETAEGKISGVIAAEHQDLKLEGSVRRLQLTETQVVNSNFNVNYVDSLIHFDLIVQQDSEQKERLEIESAGTLVLETAGMRLLLENLRVATSGQEWAKPEPVAEIRMRGSRIEVSDLSLAAGNQKITVFGVLDTLAASALHVRADSLSIAELAKLALPQSDYGGVLNLEATFSETLARPKLQGTFSITEGYYFDESFERFAGEFGYETNNLKWDFFFSKTGNDTLLAFAGFAPLQLSFSPFQTELPDDVPLEIRFAARGFDLSFLQGFMQGRGKFQGQLFADIKLENTLQDLRGDGPINVARSEIELMDLGLKYTEVNLALRLREREVVIDEFGMKSEDGSLRALTGSLSLSQSQIEKFGARLQAENFQVMNSREMQLALSGEIEVSGSIQALQFSGNVIVPEARVYYPAYIEIDTTVRLTEKPFFVISTDTVEFDSAGALRFQKSSSQTAEPLLTETDFYKKMRGNLSLILDRNVWLRSEEANIEVEGELELQKQGPDFVLFGTLSTVRGHYELQGKRFRIDQGEIVFKGDPEINPDLNIEAVYAFTDRSGSESAKREIRVFITGSKLEPEFKFTLDGGEVEEKDVFAILIFGRPFDQLGAGQKNSVAAQVSLEQQAAGLLTGELIKRLGGKLGSELSLDVLEIESGESLGDANVRVGKYVTQDVFISVTQGFGEEGDQKVELEYELPQRIVLLNLFLQASQEKRGNTGVDVIWKVDW